MRIPDVFYSKFQTIDADTKLFLNSFDEPIGSKILEVGAHDEPAALILAEAGFPTIGVDLRDYDQKIAHPLYTHIRSDFCDLPIEFQKQHLGGFDCIFSISAIEHFGIGTYQEGLEHEYYDVIAMRKIWELLKVGGSAYIIIPFGGYFIEYKPHWRVYSFAAVMKRLVQDFKVEFLKIIVADVLQLPDGRILKSGEAISWLEIFTFTGNPPHVSALFKLRKVPITRISPNGI